MSNDGVSTTSVPEPFESYSGEESYIFVSYAHLDKSSVYDAIRMFNDASINIWYDEGIQPSTEWVEEIAQAIKNSSLFVLFVSPSAVVSRFVRNEINYAVSLDKNILTVYLEETHLPEGLALCLQPYQSLKISENDWFDRACFAIQSKLSNAETDKHIVEFSSEILSEGTIDLGEQLWQNLDRVLENQTTRSIKRSSAVNKGLHKLVKDAEKKQKSTSKPPFGSSARTNKGKTRHPWTVSVGVEDDIKHLGNDNKFVDSFAGTFFWIPPGEISIWVPYAEEQRKVKVSNGFWMGRYPVTQHIFNSIMGTNPSSAEITGQGVEENLPVNNVSWLDAVSFCKALTIYARNNGTLDKNREYRLPTEVEWEYACRAGTTTDYYFGDDPNDLHYHGWFKANSNKNVHPVGLKSPNPWGLHDLYGNVREWVGKSFANTLLNDTEQDEFRISRGGGYMKTASECKSASRSTNSLHHRFRNLGFRLALAEVSL